MPAGCTRERSVLGSSRGFTLLEVLVASAILSLVLAGLYGVFSATLASRRVADQAATRTRQARTVLLRLGEELQASYRFSTRDARFVGRTQQRGSFPEATLRFMASVPSVVQPAVLDAQLTHIQYRLDVEPARPERRRLVRSARVDGTLMQEARSREVTLLAGVHGLALRFFDGRRWRDQWGKAETRGRLPVAVELVLYLAADTGEVRAYSTVVALPLGERWGGGGL